MQYVFLVSNFPKLEAHMADRYYKVLVDDYEIDETEDIHNPIGQVRYKYCACN